MKISLKLRVHKLGNKNHPKKSCSAILYTSHPPCIMQMIMKNTITCKIDRILDSPRQKYPFHKANKLKSSQLYFGLVLVFP